MAKGERYFTGKPCKYGHIAERLKSNRGCVVCAVRKASAYLARNPEKRKKWFDEGRRRYEERHPDRVSAAKARYRRTHREQLRAAGREYAAKNRAERRRKHRAYRQEYPEIHATNQLDRARKQSLATPPWVDKAAIKAIYAEARRVSSETGIAYSVDHIIPIRHPLVCGLHVPWNLRVITAQENFLKGAKIWE